MSYITTFTGRRFYYNDIKKESIFIPDVLHALPRINRFTGHSKRRYSVGEHTFLGLVMAEKLGYTPKQKLLWFIHDFTEAYVNDCPAPLKRLLPEFITIEAKVEEAILDYFGLEPLTEEEFRLVKRIDMTMLVLEMRDLTLHDHKDFINEYTYTEMLDDDDFNIGLKPLNDEFLTMILGELLDGLLREVSMKSFNIYANIKDSDEKIMFESVLFDTKEEALSFAEYLAYDLYYENPTRDILEIIKEDNVNEDIANVRFLVEMIDSVEYHVEEIKG